MTELRLTFGQGARRGLLGGVLAACLALGILAGIWQLLELGSRINLGLDELYAAQSDNHTWTIAQAETDLLAYRLALIEARERPSPETVERMKRRFDIYYSRVATIGHALDARYLADVTDLRATWSELFARAQQDAALLDASDGTSAGQIAELEENARRVAPDVRGFVLAALQSISNDGLTLREDTYELLDSFFYWTVVMIGLLVALAAGGLLTFYWIMRYLRLKTHLSARQTKVINAAIDAVLICDHVGRILEFNNTAARMFRLDEASDGLPRLEALFGAEDPVLDSVGPDGPVPGLPLWRKLGATAGPVTTCVKGPDGSLVPVECTVTQDREPDGSIIFILAMRDISQRIEREQRLESARDAAEQGEKAKSRFLAVMSHEMRTPLNGLIAALEIIQQTTRLSRRQRDFLQIALQCGHTTLEQIDDVLELTRLDDKSFSEELQEFDLAALLRSLVEQYLPMAALQGNTIDLALPDMPLPWVRGSRRTLTRAVLNLLGNAIKFTQDGLIRVTLQASVSESQGLRIGLSVSDTGAGIPADKLEVIFRDFESLSGQEQTKGTGLGLGIVRRAMDRLGGQVRVASAIGKGSTFTIEFNLPTAPTPALGNRSQSGAKPKAAPGLPEKQDRTILIAEDNEINRVVLSAMLRHLGARVELARDGEEAVRMAANTRFDLILMDLSMPRLNGIEATQGIRAGGASCGARIVGLTAHAEQDQRAMMLAAGMATVILKPVTFEKLSLLLSEVPVPVQRAGGTGRVTLVASETINDLRRAVPAAQLGAFLRRYRNEAEELLAGLEAGQADPDMVHRHAGTAAIFGAEAFRALLVELEDRWRTGEPVPASRLGDIRTCWHKTSKALNALIESEPGPMQPIL